GTPRTPPLGWIAIADALAAAKLDDLATHARRLAALAKEPGAAESLADALTQKGWTLARAGERSRAIAQLREAKAAHEAIAAPRVSSKAPPDAPENPASPSPPPNPSP